MPYTPSLIQTVTVGTGIAPVPAACGPLADCTAGGDFHPAPKTNDSVVSMGYDSTGGGGLQEGVLRGGGDRRVTGVRTGVLAMTGQGGALSFREGGRSPPTWESVGERRIGRRYGLPRAAGASK